MQPVLRDARPSDARRFEEIRIGGWKAAYRGMIDPDFLDALNATEERIASWTDRLASQAPGGVSLVAENDGIVVGFAVLLPSRDEDVPDAAELLGLYVDPARRSTGIGAALMQAGFARMPQPVHILWTLEGNGPARRFYERRGFVTDGAQKVFDVPGQPLEIRYRRTRLG